MRSKEELLSLVPFAPKWIIDWKKIEISGISNFVQEMRKTQQNPAWHGEGDVWTHTKMVCEELVKMEKFREAQRRIQEELFMAALLHDIGKIPCTKMEEGVWKSPNHTSTGAKMAREFLWKEYGFCGTKEEQNFRETICNLIRYHSVPPHILENKNPEHRLRKIMANGELAPDFSIKYLCLLEEADMKGRITDSMEESVELIHMCEELAKEAECYQYQKLFPNDYSEHMYLKGKNILPGQELFDDTWGEVILLSGLPGTGKDTWIIKHYTDMPVISLDVLRKQMNISPNDKENQGKVINAAKELAKEYLRGKKSFVWNATNLTFATREKLYRLFTDYNASVRIVYLETGWQEELRRNKNRKDAVPEQVISRMLGSLVLPERYEAHQVEWHCV